MKSCDLENIQPFVRMVKIKKAVHLEGAWEDLDNVLIYIAQGSIDYIMEGTRYHLEAGNFVLIPPYTYHIAVKSNVDALVQHIVHFDFYTDPERTEISHQSAINQEFRFPVPPQEKLLSGKPVLGSIPEKERYAFEKLFISMYREFSQREEGYRTMLKGLTIQLLMTLWRSKSGQTVSQGSSAPQKSKSWKLVESALEYIYLHFDEELDNAIISEAVNVSPNYLSKLFQNYIGMSLHTFVLNYRLDRAQQLILSGKCNITEAALKCGFTSVHTFSKTFKQKRGINPSAYAELAEKGDTISLDDQDYDLQKRIFFNQ